MFHRVEWQLLHLSLRKWEQPTCPPGCWLHSRLYLGRQLLWTGNPRTIPNHQLLLIAIVNHRSSISQTRGSKDRILRYQGIENITSWANNQEEKTRTFWQQQLSSSSTLDQSLTSLHSRFWRFDWCTSFTFRWFWSPINTQLRGPALSFTSQVDSPGFLFSKARHVWYHPWRYGWRTLPSSQQRMGRRFSPWELVDSKRSSEPSLLVASETRILLLQFS